MGIFQPVIQVPVIIGLDALVDNAPADAGLGTLYVDTFRTNW
jgi:hypothetical protein